MTETSSSPASRRSSSLSLSPGEPVSPALPETPGPIVGRDEILTRLVHLIRTSDTRLITLTGAGGTGKTRLAIELASRVGSHFADGVAFVALASVSDADHVSQAVAQAFGVRGSAEKPLVDNLVDHLQDAKALLVLDNFEHLMDAASVVSRLVTACPRTTVLVTSRAPLRLAQEREVVIPPLELPAAGARPSDIGHAASVRLYVETARAVVPGFALTPANADAVAGICRRLDGLPLAINLAASRSRILDPRSLLTRLDPGLPLLSDPRRDAPARHRTMRDTIGWSYGLLREHEQTLFRRLSVFAGGFTLELAETMSRELSGSDSLSGTPRDTSVLLLDTLETLIDHHLIERAEREGDIRFGMLETIREYALEQLEASGEGEVIRVAHAEAITAWMERAKPLMFEADQARWLARGVDEQPNVRAALEWSLTREDAATAHRLAAANGPVWLKRDMVQEARGWLDRVLALPPSAPVEAVTVCRFIASTVAASLGDSDRALQHASAGLAIAREADDRFGEGLALMMQSVLLIESDLAGAERANEAAIACMRELPGQPRMASLLVDRAQVAARQHDAVAYGRRAREAYDYAVEVEDPSGIADALIVRAQAAVTNRSWAEAMAHLRETLDIADRIESLLQTSTAVMMGAVVASSCGDHRLAVRWVEAGSAVIAAHGMTPADVLPRWLPAVKSNARKVISAKTVAAEEAAAVAVPLATIVGEVRRYRPGKGIGTSSGQSGLARLTSRENEVLRLVARGLTDPQIAEALFIARPTASRHVSNILAKLDVPSRTGAIDAAHRLGLIDEPE